MNTIFSRDNFKLCDVPAPEGYPQSQTHCSIGETEGAYYLSTSPFPVRHNRLVIYTRAIIRKLSFRLLCNDKRGEFFENPCLYKAITNGQEVVTHFIPMSDTPLMNTPDPVFGYPSFNSDPELILEEDRIFVLNRSTLRKSGGYVNRLYLIEGVDENGWYKKQSVRLVYEEQIPLISPCLKKFDDNYIFTYLDTNSYNDGCTFNGLYLSTINTLEEISNNIKWKEIDVILEEYIPWHMSLFTYENRLFSVVVCVKKGYPKRGWQMLGEFSQDLTQMRIYDTPLTDYNSYRSSAVVDKNGQFILYNAVVGESIKGGKSVDGREIVVASMDFKELLNLLQS